MGRWKWAVWVGVGLIVVVLAAALATIGTDLDRTRLEREDLEYEVEGLQEEIDTLTEERDQLKAQAEAHLKALEPQPVSPTQPTSEPGQTVAPSGEPQ